MARQLYPTLPTGARPRSWSGPPAPSLDVREVGDGGATAVRGGTHLGVALAEPAVEQR